MVPLRSATVFEVVFESGNSPAFMVLLRDPADPGDPDRLDPVGQDLSLMVVNLSLNIFDLELKSSHEKIFLPPFVCRTAGESDATYSLNPFTGLFRE
ncbi:UNVERIFIED_CONTAM: hypothetical protein PYX00_000828 [Menopon gallinae]|uniref:Uncharacterized protein n=1 Tax=Menopon gallinae TaxID=328185 RepID=A0AAW2IBR1_9NEOP